MGDTLYEPVPFRDRLKPLTERTITVPMIVLAVLTIASALVVSVQIGEYPEDAPLHDDLLQPVLALELPGSAADVRETLLPRNVLRRKAENPLTADAEASRKIEESRLEGRIRQMFRRSVYADFFFIVCYTGFFAFTLRAISVPGMLSGWRVALFAGLFDIAENILMLRVLATPLDRISDASAQLLRAVSLAKWSCIAGVLLLIGLALTRVELRPFGRPGTGLLALLMLFAGAVGMTGVLPVIPWPAGWFTLRHLELMTMLSAVFPVVILVSGVYEVWRHLPEKELAV